VATVVAGFLAFGVEKVVDVTGHPWGAIFIGASVFLVGEDDAHMHASLVVGFRVYLSIVSVLGL